MRTMFSADDSSSSCKEEVKKDELISNESAWSCTSKRAFSPSITKMPDGVYGLASPSSVLRGIVVITEGTVSLNRRRKKAYVPRVATEHSNWRCV